MIELTREIARQIGAEGEKTYPNECCGALLVIYLRSAMAA